MWYLLVLIAGLASFGARAAPIPFQKGEVLYDLQEEPLKTFLQRFFEDQGLPVVLSPAVQAQGGTLNGPRSGPPADVFRSIAESNQLAAYFDGSTVRVYKLNELSSRSFFVSPSRVADFRKAARDLGVVDEQNVYRVNADSGLVVASGTPRFLEQMLGLADSVAQVAEVVKTSFKFIPLKYAWAADNTFTVGNRQVTVPGVATLLKQLLYEPDRLAGGGFSGSRELLGRPTAERLRGRGLAAVGLPPLAPPQPAAAGDGSAGGDYSYGGGQTAALDQGAQPRAALQPVSMSQDSGLARIVADPYHNAVVVRDLPDRMSMYEDLVKALDTEMQIVEIEATIIDVDKNKLRDLGIDWRYASNRNEVLFGGAAPNANGTGGTKNDLLSALSPTNVANLPQALPGFQIGTIIGNSTQFIARINALETQDLVKVVTTPQVVTLNDVEAVIESIRELYVPVNGAYEVDLFNVTAGQVLRVTPHVIEDGGRTRLRLLVTIEDGSVQVNTSTVNNQTVNYPNVTRNAVNTQAIIDAGQSLLLGGLVSSTQTDTVNKVPVLGDIPLLGQLFRDDSKQRARTERLFLISPRLAPLNAIAGLQYQPQRLAPVPGDGSANTPGTGAGTGAVTAPENPAPPAQGSEQQ
jgi:type III secretion protein C